MLNTLVFKAFSRRSFLIDLLMCPFHYQTVVKLITACMQNRAGWYCHFIITIDTKATIYDMNTSRYLKWKQCFLLIVSVGLVCCASFLSYLLDYHVSLPLAFSLLDHYFRNLCHLLSLAWRQIKTVILCQHFLMYFTCGLFPFKVVPSSSDYIM